MHRVADFSTDCVRHTSIRTFGMSNKRHTKWTAVSPTARPGELRKLPSGYYPTRHVRIRPLARGDPYHDAPSRWRGRRGYACGHENRAFWHVYVDLADRYASQKPLLMGTPRYPLGVADVMWSVYLTRNAGRFEKNFGHGVRFHFLTVQNGRCSGRSACGKDLGRAVENSNDEC